MQRSIVAKEETWTLCPDATHSGVTQFNGGAHGDTVSCSFEKPAQLTTQQRFIEF